MTDYLFTRNIVGKWIDTKLLYFLKFYKDSVELNVKVLIEIDSRNRFKFILIKAENKKVWLVATGTGRDFF